MLITFGQKLRFNVFLLPRGNWHCRTPVSIQQPQPTKSSTKNNRRPAFCFCCVLFGVFSGKTREKLKSPFTLLGKWVSTLCAIFRLKPYSRRVSLIKYTYVKLKTESLNSITWRPRPFYAEQVQTVHFLVFIIFILVN